MSNGGPRAFALSVAVALLALVAPLGAGADEGDDGSRAEARVELSCTANSRVRLRVRTRDEGELRIDLEVRTPRRGGSWKVVTLHERRLVSRVQRRTGESSGSFSARWTLPDWPGTDTVTVRATGPRGEICQASATVAGN